MNRPSTLLVLLVLAGCSAPQARVGEGGTRTVATQYHGGGETILGPFSTEGQDQLEGLSVSGRAAAVRLLEQGAVGFSVLIPDYCMSIEGNGQPPLLFARIVFVRDHQGVGDFEAK